VIISPGFPSIDSQSEQTNDAYAAGPGVPDAPENPPSAGEAHAASASNDNLQGIASDFASSADFGTTSEGPLGLPSVPGQAEAAPSNITHPIRPSIAAPKPEASSGPSEEALNKFVDGADPYPNQRPSVQSHDVESTGLKAHNEEGKDSMEGMKKGMPGHIPEDEGKLTEHPDYADYSQRRPEQTLSHFSSVMLYHSQNAGTLPVEIQYGSLRQSDGSMKLYSSSNSYAGQQWLKNNSSGDNLLGLVKSAAKQTDDPEVQRHALKLLNFGENQEARKQSIESNPKLSREDKDKQLDELKQSDDLHKEFFTGTHHVVTNSTALKEGGAAVRPKVKGEQSGPPPPPMPTKKNDKATQRHAEQNIATQMHIDAGKDGGSAEIAGTKIRCGSCNTELGASIKDADEGFSIAGQFYPGQSSKTKMEDTVAETDGRGRPQFKTSTKTGARSSSTSPARLNDGGSFYKFKQPRSPEVGNA
jgi:hypothetical protein